MPILPDVRQEYNMNVGQMPDVSGAAEEAAFYNTVGQLSRSAGQLATQVSRDLHVQAADLETTEAVSRYNAESAAYYDILERDSELDFVKGSKQIAEEFKARQAARKQSLLDNAGSFLAKSQIEARLANSEAEESLKFLGIKQKRMIDSKGAYLQKTQNNFSSSLMSTDSTFDGASRGYMNLVNDVFATFKDYMPEDERQSFLTKTADQGALMTLSSYKSRGEIDKAAAQFFGPAKAAQIYGIMTRNHKAGKDGAAGFGERINDKPGYFRVKMSDTETVEVKLSDAIWESSPYAYVGDSKSGIEPIGITAFPQDGILKDISPQTRMQMFADIMSDLSKRPKKDSSLANLKLNSALALSKNAELSDKAYNDLMQPAVLENLDDAGLAKAGAVIATKEAQNYIKSIEKQKISRQDEMIKNLDAAFPAIMQSISQKPEFKLISQYLGKGDEKAGREELLDSELATRKVRDAFHDAAMKRQAQLEKDSKEDIGKVALSRLDLTPQAKDSMDYFFVQGGITQPHSVRSPRGQVLKDILSDTFEKADELADKFGIPSRAISNEHVARIKYYLKANYQNAGELTNIVSNLKDAFPSAQKFNEFMADQLGEPTLAAASIMGNYTAIHDLVRANQYMEKNKTNFQDNDKFKDFKDTVVGSDDFENVKTALLQAANSSQPAVVDALRNDFVSLAMYYKSTGYGMSDTDAIKKAAETLIYKDHEVVVEKKSWFSPSKRDLALIVKKSEGVNSETVKTAIKATVGNKEWLRSQAIPYPKEVMQDAKMTGDYDRFLDTIVSNYSARTGPNGIEVGFVYNKQFVPLPNNNGGLINLRIKDIKIAAQKAEELKNKKRYERVSVMPGAVSSEKSFILGTDKWYDSSTQNFIGRFLLGDDDMTHHQFLKIVTPAEIDDFNKLENPNIDRDYNKIMTGTFNGVTATTIGGSMTASALKDVMDFRGIDRKGMSNEAILKYFQKSIKTKQDFLNIQKDFMLKNKQNVKTQLAPLSNNAQRFFIMDLANVIGSGAVNKYRLGEVLANQGFEAVEKILDSNSPYVVQDGIVKTLREAYRGNIVNNKQRFQRYQLWRKMM